MGKTAVKNEKVFLPQPPVTQTKVGYTPILRGDDYGSRIFDMNNDPLLFETRKECEDIHTVGENDCVAIAKVTWEE